jgi:isoquinoline 1-oxidoreductase beta subunit
MFAPPPTGKPNAYIHIGTDDWITFYIPKGEMGQGPTTACSQLLAEELECDWAKVRMEIAAVDPDSFGHQTTVGSRAIRSTWEPLRKAGAEAREMLIRAAAEQWGVSPSQCRAENGMVINTINNARINFGRVADAAAKLPVPQNVRLKDPKAFRIIGKPVHRLDTRDKVTGRAVFGIDARPDGLVYAVVERCPVFGGKVASFDASKANAVAGVKDVVQISRGVAVIADSTWAAMQGRRTLTVRWDEGAGASTTSAGISRMFAERTKEAGAVARREGDVDTALANAAKRVDAVYEAPFLAHASMEPMNCTVHARGETAEVWAPTQSPTTSRAVVAEVLGLRPEKVVFHTLFCGGGFGRRGEGELDYVAEAAEVAKHTSAPVKVTWSREDDMQHDYYRPASYVDFSGGVDAEGWPIAWRARVACPSFGFLRDGVDGTAVGGLSNVLYNIPNFLVDYRVANTIVPVSYWRAPGASQNTFFAECFLDELCAAGGKDPVEVRRRLLAKEPRLLNVLNLAADKAGWGNRLPEGRYRGVAVGANVGSFNAQIAEVSIAGGKVRVHRVVCAFDCGQIINPAILTQQIEGGIIYGLSAALKGEITIDRGRVQQANFNNHDVLRIDEAPVIEVHLVRSAEEPTGAGEAVNPTIVPAVANAVFAATGKPVRKLPIRM